MKTERSNATTTLTRRLRLLLICLLLSLWATSSSGQSKSPVDTAYVTVNKSGDTVVNNLSIEVVKRANEEHINYVGCQADLDSCESNRRDAINRGSLYLLKWKDTEEQRNNDALIKANLTKALKDAQANSDAFEKKLNRNIKLTKFLIPAGVVVTAVGVVVGFVLGRKY